MKSALETRTFGVAALALLGAGNAFAESNAFATR